MIIEFLQHDRGYGGTEKPVGVKNYTMEILIEDVAQLVSDIHYLSLSLQ